MSRRNHKPTRTCLGCRNVDEKDALVRIAAIDGRIVLDAERRFGGRGGYLHPRRECLERFVKAKDKEFRSLRQRIAPVVRIELVNSVSRLATSARL